MKKTYLRQIKNISPYSTNNLDVVTFETEEERKEDKSYCEYGGSEVRYFELKEKK